MGCGSSKQAYDGSDGKIQPAANYGPPPQGYPNNAGYAQPAPETRRQKNVKRANAFGFLTSLV
ncbi:hypothetical protein E4U21_002206 [Claviceps maximensis]|nr:hypothetical protein E4U21_002206 [Claviceps maximensis]